MGLLGLGGVQGGLALKDSTTEGTLGLSTGLEKTPAGQLGESYTNGPGYLGLGGPVWLLYRTLVIF
jgi:hypothetical protein